MNIPGFIDLQVNGCMGIDYCSSSLTSAEIISSCEVLLQRGTIGFLPTIITTSETNYRQNLKKFVAAIEQSDLARKMILGIHLEGPFISAEDGFRGAHPKEHVQLPSIQFLKKCIDWSDGMISMITIAAELPGASELCAFCVENGIAVSLGHQNATYEQICTLNKAGATGLTHLGNANKHLLDRHKNPIIAGLAHQEFSAMFISDGHHIPDELIQLILKAKRTSHCFVVSDASVFSAMPVGRYVTSWGMDVEINEKGRLFNPHTGYLVGSSSTMLECMNYLSSLKLLTLVELEQMGFYNPLNYLGITQEKITLTAPLHFSDNRFFIPSFSN